MRLCTENDIDEVLGVVRSYVPAGFPYDIEDVFLGVLSNKNAVVCMPDDRSFCLFINIGGGEYDLHAIGTLSTTRDAILWMLSNYDGCDMISWKPATKALRRLCRIADLRFGSSVGKNGRHYFRKDMTCRQ